VNEWVTQRDLPHHVLLDQRPVLLPAIVLLRSAHDCLIAAVRGFEDVDIIMFESKLLWFTAPGWDRTYRGVPRA